MRALLSLVVALQTASAQQPAGSPARNPAYARDGRLAVSIAGDLWILEKTGKWVQLTSGPAWDREPSWSADGSALIFSSDRSGNFDLWRLAVNGETGAI